MEWTTAALLGLTALLAFAGAVLVSRPRRRGLYRRGSAVNLADPDRGPQREWYAQRVATDGYRRFLREVHEEAPVEVLELDRDWPVAQALGHAFIDERTEQMYLTMDGWRVLKGNDDAKTG